MYVCSYNLFGYALTTCLVTIQLHLLPALTALVLGLNAGVKAGLVLHAALLATLALLITSTTVRCQACSINKLLLLALCD
jgi:uncharacterized membrane protein